MYKSDLNLLTLQKIRELKAALNLINHKQILTVKLELSLLYIFTLHTTSKFCSQTKLSNQPNNIRDEHGSFVISLQHHHRHIHHMFGKIRGQRGRRESRSARFAVSPIRGQRDLRSAIAVSAIRGQRDSRLPRFPVTAIRG